MCLMLSDVYGGRDRTGAGRRGKTVIMFIHILYGGRGRAKAGRRGKTVSVFIY